MLVELNEQPIDLSFVQGGRNFDGIIATHDDETAASGKKNRGRAARH